MIDLLGSFKGLTHFSSFAVCSKLVCLLHSRCLYSTAAAVLGGHLISLSTGISKTLLSSAAAVLHFHRYPLIGSFHGAKASTSLHDPFNPGLSNATEATLSPMASAGISSAKYQLLLLHVSKPVPSG